MSKSAKNHASLATRLVRGRLERGKTQAEVAVASGISDSYYGEIEHGKRVPPLSRMSKILNAIGFSALETREILQLAAQQRGLSPDDIDLPEEVQELIAEIRKHARSMTPRFVKGLCTKIREVV